MQGTGWTHAACSEEGLICFQNLKGNHSGGGGVGIGKEENLLVLCVVESFLEIWTLPLSLLEEGKV